MNFKKQITINCPPEKVWTVFTTPETWKTWWGGMGLTSADWRESGQLNWGVGGHSTILKLIPGQLIRYQLTGAYTKTTTYTFEAQQKGATTLVSVEQAFTGVTGGANKAGELEDELTKLKALVEKGS